MADPIIVNLDDNGNEIKDAVRLDLHHWQDVIRFGCSMRQFRLFHTALQQQLPAQYGPVLLGSGDFHHVSLLLLDNLKHQHITNQPIDIVVFDNHPDNMRYLFGIHCGSWVSHAARLPFVRHIHVLGITSNDIALSHSWENRLLPLIKNKLTYWSMDVDVSWAKHLGLAKAFRHFDSPDELIKAFFASQAKNTCPVYLSIDKDVFGRDVVQTNWDQGRFGLAQMLEVIAFLKSRIIASDITGDISVYAYKHVIKRLLSALDKQPSIDAQDLREWQKQHNQVNLQLIQALS